MLLKEEISITPEEAQPILDHVQEIAGLHFDDSVLEALAARDVSVAQVTLHVGAGTFSPVRVDDVADHNMHFERFEIPVDVVDAISATRERGGRVAGRCGKTACCH